MMYATKQGFTLIELAVVIAIIAILSSVAIQRLSGLVGGAEYALAINFGKSLNSSSSTYIASNGRVPNGYTDFVTNDVTQVNDQTYTVALPTSTRGKTLCSAPTATEILCGDFETLIATYTYDNGITSTNIVDK